MNHPKLTVLMTVHNGLNHLGSAISSILSQTYSDFEFLIINDGSTEPVHTIFQANHDSRMIIVDQANVGLTRSLNKGLAMAKGEYVARMDSDDLSLPGRLEAQVRAMDSNPGLDLIGSYFDVIDEHNNLAERKELIGDPCYRLWRLQFHNNYGHGSVMLRKSSVLEAGMYDESFQVTQDFDLWSRLSRKDNTMIIPAVLYRYRMIGHGKQASVMHYDAQLQNAVRISNRSLQACNPRLVDADCVHIRTLYWKFQLKHLSHKGIGLLIDTLEGFCTRFSLDSLEKRELVKRVCADVIKELEEDASIPAPVRMGLRSEFLALYQNYPAH